MQRTLLTPSLMLCLALSFSCKRRQGDSFELKGVLVTEKSKQVNYGRLYNYPGEWQSFKLADSKTAASQSDKPVIWTVFFAYADPELTADPRYDGSLDSGSVGAYDTIWWLVDQHKAKGSKLLAGEPEPTNVTNLPGNPLPLLSRGKRLDPRQLYAYRAHLYNTPVMFTQNGKVVKKNVNIDFRLYLGPNIDPLPNMQRGGARNLMPDQHREALAHAFRDSDVLVYNGHIWSMDSHWRRFHPQANLQAPPDQNTADLVDRINKLSQSGKRDRYGVFFVNACHTEIIETHLMNALYSKEHQEEPLLLSHRNYSNYGYFGAQNTWFLTNLLQGQSLEKIIYDMTARVETQGNQKKLAFGGLPMENPPGQASEVTRTTLQNYYRNNKVELNQKAVLIVAYDFEVSNTGSGRLPPSQ